MAPNPLVIRGANRYLARAAGMAIVAGLLLGCGTTRMTDTQRTATEQLLISSAVDQAVSRLDFRSLAEKSVFLDVQYLDSTIDKGYLVSSLRQSLLAQGCLLQEDKTKATYVVEARSGGIGTDHYSLLVGVPQISVPTFVPGQPSQIPEIPFAKKTDEQAIAKIAVFAYNRRTGQRLWQSGAVEASSSARDRWIAGLGPFRGGTIVRGTEFAGQEIGLPLQGDKEEGDQKPAIDRTPVTAAASWPEPPPARQPLLVLLARAALGASWPLKKPGSTEAAETSKAAPAREAISSATAPAKPSASDNRSPSASPPGAEAKPPAPANSVNLGGQAETAPARILISGLSWFPER
jgi:hypothetical protein